MFEKAQFFLQYVTAKQPPLCKTVDATEEALNTFFAKIKARVAALAQTKAVPASLQKFTTFHDLLKIYQFVLDKQTTIRSELYQAPPQTFFAKVIHWLKRLIAIKPSTTYRQQKIPKQLARTINIIRDINGEFLLMLETKSKLASGVKDALTPKFTGTHKRGKPAWQIEGAEPQEWINMVVKERLRKGLAPVLAEAALTEFLVGSHPDAQQFINYLLLGEQYVRNKSWRQTLYSRRAWVAFGKLIENNLIVLAEKEKQQLIFDLLSALKIIHDNNIVHGDIHSLNILTYRNLEQVRAKLTDFGQAFSSAAMGKNFDIYYLAEIISLLLTGKTESKAHEVAISPLLRICLAARNNNAITIDEVTAVAKAQWTVEGDLKPIYQQYGMSSLMQAIVSGNAKEVAAGLARNDEIDQQDGTGHTALLYALACGDNQTAAELLFVKKANLKIYTFGSDSALDYATANEKIADPILLHLFASAEVADKIKALKYIIRHKQITRTLLLRDHAHPEVLNYVDPPNGNNQQPESTAPTAKPKAT